MPKGGRLARVPARAKHDGDPGAAQCPHPAHLAPPRPLRGAAAAPGPGACGPGNSLDFNWVGGAVSRCPG